MASREHGRMTHGARASQGRSEDGAHCRERPGAARRKGPPHTGHQAALQGISKSCHPLLVFQLSNQPQVETSEPISGFTLGTELNPGPCSGRPCARPP